MGRSDTPKENIENMLRMKQLHFPEHPLDWEFLLDKLTYSSQFSFQSTFIERMQFLFKCGLSSRVEALAFKVWRDCITNMIQTAGFESRRNNQNNLILREIRRRIIHFQKELPKLKEATTILELALWKNRLDENGHTTTYCQKKMRTDESSIRSQNRVTCGADVVIGHVLPFLINTDGFFD